YIVHPKASCFWLLKHVACCARFLAEAKAGNNMAARIAMMAITTSSSIRVNASADFLYVNFIISNHLKRWRGLQTPPPASLANGLWFQSYCRRRKNCAE